jgi:hypothetical protein
LSLGPVDLRLEARAAVQELHRPGLRAWALDRDREMPLLSVKIDLSSS